MRGCVKSCRTHGPHLGETRCASCRRDDDEKWNELAELHELSAGHARALECTPATDEERRRWLDEVAPLAGGRGCTKGGVMSFETQRELYLRTYVEGRLRLGDCYRRQAMLAARRDAGALLDQLQAEEAKLTRELRRMEAVLTREFEAAPQVGMVAVSARAPGCVGRAWCSVGLVAGRIVCRETLRPSDLPGSFLYCDEVDEAATVDQAVS